MTVEVVRGEEAGKRLRDILLGFEGRGHYWAFYERVPHFFVLNCSPRGQLSMQHPISMPKPRIGALISINIRIHEHLHLSFITQVQDPNDVLTMPTELFIEEG